MKKPNKYAAGHVPTPNPKKMDFGKVFQEQQEFMSLCIAPKPEEVVDFCQELVPESAPVLVKVEAAPESLANECFLNVPRQIATNGGSLVCGWTIWLFRNMFVQAEFHGCWKSPSGELIDITPKNETQILFLPDPNRTWQGQRVGNVFKAIHSAPVVGEWIEAQKRLAELTPVGSFIPTPEMLTTTLQGIELTSKLMELHRRNV